MPVRKATAADLDRVVEIYDAIHAEEEAGRLSTGWRRGIYPGRESAAPALAAGTLHVLEKDGIILGSAIIDSNQPDAYQSGKWRQECAPEKVMVIHTLTIDPACLQAGLGREFMRFYANHAHSSGCSWLRLDTNVINSPARAFYKKLGFAETGTVRTPFHGLQDVTLVLLEREAIPL